MDTKDVKRSAHKEQSGNNEIDTGNTDNKANLKMQGEPEKRDEKSGPDASPGNTGLQADNKVNESDKAGEVRSDKEDKAGSAAEKEIDISVAKTQNQSDSAKKAGNEGKSDDTGQQIEGDAVTEKSDDAVNDKADDSKSEGTGETGPESSDKPRSEVSEESEPEDSEKPLSGDSGKSPPEDSEKAETEKTSSEVKSEDYPNLDKEGLLKVLEELIDNKSVHNIRNEVEAIKVCFYKRHKAEIEQKRKRFMQEGGDVEAFDPGEDQGEIRFKELYRKYRHSKAAYNRSIEHTRQANLEEKHKVIEDLKELVNRNEDINLTFQEFRKLQKRWHEIGMVPQHNLKDLWNTYHHYVETFYDHIKINKELRDLDLKKNLESKIKLCEKAEELLLEPNIINAFRQLQRYHDQWRETGPVPRDQKDVIWERFREVTHQINKKHQEHFDKLKESQKKNLETKTLLCEKAEAINEIPLEDFKQVDKLTREMINLQRTWKTVGFAPKKDNNRIYQRFRTVCDKFFARKREFNAHNNEYLNDNLQKKMDLCVQAEALKDSSDWKKTSDELIALQKRWKEIGPVPRKHYDPIWKRFRAACDHFFSRKAEFFNNMDSKYEENLKKKLALIEKIENFEFGRNLDTGMDILKEYQREWVSIGFVPIKEKDKIQKRYRAALDKHFEGLKMDDHNKNLMKFKHKLEGVKEKPNAYNKMKFEREKFLNRFKQLESDITLWENNIGFFAKSKTADATIKEFKGKIEKGKKQMELLEEKIRMIDELDNE